MTLLLIPLPGNEALAQSLARALRAASGSALRPSPVAALGAATVRRFADGESYVRILSPVRGRAVAVVATLDRPDDKVLPLVFLAATARDLGAAAVGLVAPYLAYMRQDVRFRAGEGVTSSYFASLLSGAMDWLVTVDPHLHRRSNLGEIYRIPAEVVHAAPRVSAWIREHVPRPLLVGPDAESAQWVRAVADAADAPCVVLEKVRRGDRDVSVSVPEVERWRDRTPVLVDDIIATARTMAETVGHLRRGGLAAPVCVGVHAVFAEGAAEALAAAGAARVITCNTIAHPSNGIDLTVPLAEAVARAAGLEPSAPHAVAAGGGGGPA